MERFAPGRASGEAGKQHDEDPHDLSEAQRADGEVHVVEPEHGQPDAAMRHQRRRGAREREWKGNGQA